MPMQQANSELSEKSGMLQAEKKLLEEELKRWKVRTQVRKKAIKEKIIIMKNVACKKRINTSFIRKLDCLVITIFSPLFYHFTPLTHNNIFF